MMMMMMEIQEMKKKKKHNVTLVVDHVKNCERKPSIKAANHNQPFEKEVSSKTNALYLKVGRQKSLQLLVAPQSR
jgi:hypothetical protein